MFRKKLSRLSRRKFIGTAQGVAATSLFAGCRTAESLSQRKSELVDTEIVSAAIHPAIGVARVGNSETDFYYGPEIVEPQGVKAEDMRDATGALKRQAARFRVFGYNRHGQVVKELNLDDSQVTHLQWSVHVANKKPNWYRFSVAYDIPESQVESLTMDRRNRWVDNSTQFSRSDLEIDPGERSISGKNMSGVDYRFQTASFMKDPGHGVYLGELRTDEAGRLVFLGGLGKAASPTNKPVFYQNDFSTFNNADEWYDDISDGPVKASVQINGESIPVKSAWVIVGPPNYAPDIVGWRTLYDMLKDVYYESGMLEKPLVTKFSRDVYPIFQRLSGMQWVNAGFAKAFANVNQDLAQQSNIIEKINFDDPAFIASLAKANPTPEELELRRSIVRTFRSPGTDSTNWREWPWLYGDAFGTYKNSPRMNLTLSMMRETHLFRWAQISSEGNYVDDWNQHLERAELTQVDHFDLAEQPEILDQAALHYCLADAFHPGCEITWPLRHPSIFSEPFRIRAKEAGVAEKDYGPELTYKEVFKFDGPLTAQGPGGLTRWMAMPWHGDTVGCRSGYNPQEDPYLPAFWPARVPNHVISARTYAIIMDANENIERRKQAFMHRDFWHRPLKGGFKQQIDQMIAGPGPDFSYMGIVEARPGPTDPAGSIFPSIIYVETFPPENLETVQIESFGTALETTFETDNAMPKGTGPDVELKKAGWESQEQYDEFRKAMGFDD